MKVDLILRDEIQLGDKITYRIDGHKKTKFIGRLEDIPFDGKILSIERPTTFGIVAETDDVDEEILPKEERDYLKKILDSGILEKNIKITSICFSKDFRGRYVQITFYSKDFAELEILCHDYYFDGVPDNSEYTLEELGL